jgi:hypothetical protein
MMQTPTISMVRLFYFRSSLVDCVGCVVVVFLVPARFEGRSSMYPALRAQEEHSPKETDGRTMGGRGTKGILPSIHCKMQKKGGW